MDYYEDVAVGTTREFGRYEVTEAEIVEFAERYDPQRIHTDPEAAGESRFGTLVASGWHTAAITMRLLVQATLSKSATVAGLGVDDLRWRNPVRPGDVLHVETEVVDKEPWESDLGLVRTRTRTVANGDTEVLSMVRLSLFERREPREDG